MTADALWFLGRGTGVAAVVLLSLSVVLGVLSRAGVAVPGLGRFAAADLHRTAALTATGLVAVHVVGLTLDPYANLRLVDWVVPFLGSFRPAWQGLGTLAVDLLAVVVVVSLLRHRVGPRVFRAVHWLTYAMWPVAVLHGLGNGTDGTTPWFLGVTLACVAAVAAALAWRLTPAATARGRRRVARRTPSASRVTGPVR